LLPHPKALISLTKRLLEPTPERGAFFQLFAYPPLHYYTMALRSSYLKRILVKF